MPALDVLIRQLLDRVHPPGWINNFVPEGVLYHNGVALWEQPRNSTGGGFSERSSAGPGNRGNLPGRPRARHQYPGRQRRPDHGHAVGHPPEFDNLDATRPGAWAPLGTGRPERRRGSTCIRSRCRHADQSLFSLQPAFARTARARCADLQSSVQPTLIPPSW